MMEPAGGDVASLDEARRVITELRERCRAQAHQVIAWRRRAKLQDELLERAALARHEQLRDLSAQLLLFEARLCRKQNTLGAMMAQRDAVIARQAAAIRALQARLVDAGLDDDNPDSLNDSDSAVIMEDDAPPTYRAVIRSVSDAVEPSSLKRVNGLLRRPEVLETVYSVEEDGDEEVVVRLYDGDPPAKPDEPVVTTYNRVMSNHRNVTKPKDVKYKRINKAKSKSLEELRGRLRNWVDKGNKIGIGLTLDQSYA